MTQRFKIVQIKFFWLLLTSFGKISAQPHTTLCVQFLDRENNDKNNRLPLGKQICFTIKWGSAEILPFVFRPFKPEFYSALGCKLKVCNLANRSDKSFVYFCLQEKQDQEEDKKKKGTQEHKLESLSKDKNL